ncbi:hypothetical protein Pla108_17020 [Botrimarina colliarenosi]|uniref:Dockerin domain-containing protein n=1 Tax=Botrimarina colliarenosi TaxID=2528001 RepID=A0A5C6ADN5_9BACT|nr:dockerin type I domain-containing protein [Botrimarina colliarenosi]TWT97550.1 hypothetical protein Pla108_17020 [Botrimarina colliarenosi]
MRYASAPLSLLAAFVVLTSSARSEILAYEGFDYAAGSLSGANGGYGWENAWSVSNDAVVVPGSLAYNDGVNNLPTTGGHVVVGGAAGTATAVRTLVSNLTLSPGDYWMSFVGRRDLPHPDTPNNYARAAAFQTQYLGSSSVEQFSVGKVTTSIAGSVTQTWDLFSIQANPQSITSTGVDQSTQVMALMQVTIVGGDDEANDDTVNLWINPSLDENVPLGTPDAINTGFDDYLFDSLRLFAGGSTADGLYAQVAIDEIRLGTTLKDALTGQILAGDTNGDGAVTAADLTPIRTNYRQSVSFRSEGDLNGDGVVSFADFRQFKDALLGAGASLEGLNLTFLSVPEPNAAVLGGLALGFAAMFRRRRVAAVVAVALLATMTPSTASAAITAVGDSEDGYGVSPAVFTVDPFAAAANANRGIANTRKLRQTFQNPADINVGEIVLSFDVTGGSTVGGSGDTGLAIRIFEVADTLASSWLPLGLPIKEFVLPPGEMPGSNQTLSFTLTDGDIFLLPARSIGAEGYGLEISTPLALSSDGNPGVLYFSNDSMTDSYPAGRYYTEGGSASSSYRDIGLSLIGTDAEVCIPGDVNCDGTVDVDNDLSVIAGNFRQAVSGREFGDLTSNGVVDFDDFDQWKTNYTGSLANVNLAFLSVPEPAALGLVMLATTVVVARRRR